ncbi:8303_t:CDS:2 [Ambispora leptoticha]|uniref:8303_t:CDS:1 n=1 Tax=Ambispora leptoticha TaxID=144679 RepID=A0A9N8WJU3_9GLOM|nr:8303_t:CDS:2 [Ambispora leptoticha]
MATMPSQTKTQKPSGGGVNVSNSNNKSSKKIKSKRPGRKTASKTKVVVRRLPPNVPEEKFMESVKQWANEKTIDWYRFHPGRVSKSKNKENIFSRAYFHFKTDEMVLEFHREYDNHLFVDSKGNETRAVVEFAPFQKLPKERKKPDPRQGTIESDPDYLAFVESLKAEESAQLSSKEAIAQEGGTTQLEKLETRLAIAAANAAAAAAATEKPKTTPLLEHLRAIKSGLKANKLPPPKTIIKSSSSSVGVMSPPSTPKLGGGIGNNGGGHSNNGSKQSKSPNGSPDAQSYEQTPQTAVGASTSSSASSPEKKFDAREMERERDTKRKFSIQPQQKDKIRQIIQRPVPKKEDESETIENQSTTSLLDSKVSETDQTPPAVAPSAANVKTESSSSPIQHSISSYRGPPKRPKDHGHPRRREKERNKKMIAEAKTPEDVEAEVIFQDVEDGNKY